LKETACYFKNPKFVALLANSKIPGGFPVGTSSPSKDKKIPVVLALEAPLIGACGVTEPP
jgi:hypothetical protein